MKKSILLAALLAAATMTATAQSQSNAPNHPLPKAPPQAIPPGTGTPPPMQPAMKPITRDEVVRIAVERFDTADLNKDGVLSIEEQMAARDKFQAQFRARQAAGPGTPPPGAPVPPPGAPGTPPKR